MASVEDIGCVTNKFENIKQPSKPANSIWSCITNVGKWPEIIRSQNKSNKNDIKVSEMVIKDDMIPIFLKTDIETNNTNLTEFSTAESNKNMNFTEDKNMPPLVLPKVINRNSLQKSGKRHMCRSSSSDAITEHSHASWIHNISIHEFYKVERDLVSNKNRVEMDLYNNARSSEKSKIMSMLLEKVKRLELQIRDLQFNSNNNDNDTSTGNSKQQNKPHEKNKKKIVIKQSPSFSKSEEPDFFDNPQKHKVMNERRGNSVKDNKEKKSGRKKMRNSSKDDTERNKSLKNSCQIEKDKIKDREEQRMKQKNDQMKDEKESVDKTENHEKKLSKSLKATDKTDNDIDFIATGGKKIRKNRIQANKTAEVKEQRTVLLLLNKIKNLELQFNNLNKSMDKNKKINTDKCSSHNIDEYNINNENVVNRIGYCNSNKIKHKDDNVSRNCKSTESILPNYKHCFIQENEDVSTEESKLKTKFARFEEIKFFLHVNDVKHLQQTSSTNAIYSSDTWSQGQDCDRITNEKSPKTVAYKTVQQLEGNKYHSLAYSRSDTNIFDKRNKKKSYCDYKRLTFTKISSIRKHISNVDNVIDLSQSQHDDCRSCQHDELPTKETTTHHKILIKSLSPMYHVPKLIGDTDTDFSSKHWSDIELSNLCSQKAQIEWNEHIDFPVADTENIMNEEKHNTTSNSSDSKIVVSTSESENKFNVLSGNNQIFSVCEESMNITAHAINSEPADSNNYNMTECKTFNNFNEPVHYNFAISKNYITAQERKMREESKNMVSPFPFYRHLLDCNSSKANCSFPNSEIDSSNKNDSSNDNGDKTIDIEKIQNTFMSYSSTVPLLIETENASSNVENSYQIGSTFAHLSSNYNYYIPQHFFNFPTFNYSSSGNFKTVKNLAAEESHRSYAAGERFGESFKHIEYKPTVNVFSHDHLNMFKPQLTWKSITGVMENQNFCKKAESLCDCFHEETMKAKVAAGKQSKSLCNLTDNITQAKHTDSLEKLDVINFSKHIPMNDNTIAYLVFLDQPKVHLIKETKNNQLPDEIELKRLVKALRNRIDDFICEKEIPQYESHSLNEMNNKESEIKKELEKFKCKKGKSKNILSSSSNKKSRLHLKRFKSHELKLSYKSQSGNNEIKHKLYFRRSKSEDHSVNPCKLITRAHINANDSKETNVKLGKIVFKVDKSEIHGSSSNTITCFAEIVQESISPVKEPAAIAEGEYFNSIKEACKIVESSKSECSQSNAKENLYESSDTDQMNPASQKYIVKKSDSSNSSNVRKGKCKSCASSNTIISCQCIKTGINVCFPPYILGDCNKSEVSDSGTEQQSGDHWKFDDYLCQDSNKNNYYYREISELKKEVYLQRKEVNELKSIWSKCSSRLEDIWKSKDHSRSRSAPSELLSVNSDNNGFALEKKCHNTNLNYCSLGGQIPQIVDPGMIYAFKSLAESSLFLSKILNNAGTTMNQNSQQNSETLKVPKMLFAKQNQLMLLHKRNKSRRTKKFENALIEKSEYIDKQLPVSANADRNYECNSLWKITDKGTQTSSSSFSGSQENVNNRSFVKNNINFSSSIKNNTKLLQKNSTKLQPIQKKNNKMFIKDTGIN